MKEGMPQPEVNDGPENPSRRGFLRKAIGAGAAVALGAYALHEDGKNDEPNKQERAIPVIIHPWDGRPLEDLSWEELTDEIRLNLAREVSMSRLDEVSDPSIRLAQLSELAQHELEYFLKPYRDMAQMPTNEAVHEELLILRDRIRKGREERNTRPEYQGRLDRKEAE
jgi:hypothetical protein